MQGERLEAGGSARRRGSWATHRVFARLLQMLGASAREIEKKCPDSSLREEVLLCGGAGRGTTLLWRVLRPDPCVARSTLRQPRLKMRQLSICRSRPPGKMSRSFGAASRLGGSAAVEAHSKNGSADGGRAPCWFHCDEMRVALFVVPRSCPLLSGVF